GPVAPIRLLCLHTLGRRRPSMHKPWIQRIVVTSVIAVALGLSSGSPAEAHSSDDLDQDNHQREETLYIWAGDQERTRPDFLAVIDFNERSPTYGRVLRTGPLPPAR